MNDKRCRVCGESKPLSEFSKNTGARDGHRNECKPCIAAASRRYYAENRDRVGEAVREYRVRHPEEIRNRKRAWLTPERSRRYWLRHRYGITEAEYAAMAQRQGGRCAICRELPADEQVLHVDHNHKTGALRGLLCGHCNRLLGQAKENPETLLTAAAYLAGLPSQPFTEGDLAGSSRDHLG